MHHIERLREKPNHKKKQIAFFTSAAVTLAIFAFWMVSLEATGQKQQMAKTGNKSLVSPFKAVTENVAGVFESISGSREMFKKAITGTTNVQVEVVPAGNPAQK